MNRRMINYMGYIIAQYGLPVYSCVIYLRRNAGRHDPGCYTQELPGHFIYVEYKVIRLSEMDGQSILEGGQAGLLPFAPLMKPPLGIERGGREHTMDAILDVLEIRFDPAVADQVAGRLRTIEDLQRLKQLHRSAVQVADLGEFQRALDAEA